MSNAQPHTHEVQIRTSYSSNKRLVIDYGDQQKIISTVLPGFEGRLKRKITRIIKKHDKGSLKYAKKESHLAQAQALATEKNRLFLVPDRYGRSEPFEGAWGTDTPEKIKAVRVEAEAYAMHRKWLDSYEGKKWQNAYDSRNRKAFIA
jgi:hypothetical protein